MLPDEVKKQCLSSCVLYLTMNVFFLQPNVFLLFYIVVSVVGDFAAFNGHQAYSLNSLVFSSISEAVMYLIEKIDEIG